MEDRNCADAAANLPNSCCRGRSAIYKRSIAMQFAWISGVFSVGIPVPAQRRKLGGYWDFGHIGYCYRLNGGTAIMLFLGEMLAVSVLRLRN